MKPIEITYTKNFAAPLVERKHIILMDGTWNDETGIGADMLVTNIVHLARIFKDDNKDQIVRYHRGVGNDNDNKFLPSIWKGANGRAIIKIIDKAYARFVQDWQNGDRIYIFGFSRGAAAARMLATKIEKLGVPPSVTIKLIPDENKETKVIEQEINHVHYGNGKPQKVEIEFLGVWDTVSSIGLVNNFFRFIGFKSKDLFTNRDIAPNIQRAVHLVAIDETRNAFVPSLMNQKEDVTHEVWFPGVHSDVGGSFKEDEIAQVSLYYMIKCLTNWNKERGLKKFKVDDHALKKYTTSNKEIRKAHFHLRGDGLGKDLRPIYVQQNGQPTDQTPKIHHLYYDLVAQRNSYSVVKVRKSIFKKKVWRTVNFQYMPFNVKKLKEFEIEE